MKSFTHKYIDNATLESFISKENLKNKKNIFIQIFSGVIEQEFLEALLKTVGSHFPSAHIIGSTTDGEIHDHKVSTEEVYISISYFENVSLKSAFIDTGDSYEDALSLYDLIANNKTKLIISFCDGMYSNGEDVLNAFNDKNKKMIVAGGMAGDNAVFEKTYIMHQGTLSSTGLVGVSFESDTLEVNTHYNFDWVPIGNEMMITKSEGNRVYEINGMSAYDIYKKYLGVNAARELPRIGVEFPLITKVDGIDVARAMLNKHDDGSLSFAGNLAQGSRVRFGIGNPQLIISSGKENALWVQEYPVESVFIYSCMARRRFLQENAEKELSLYPKDIPVSGFFTYGEFYSSKETKQLLNQSMTVLMLSESKDLLKPCTQALVAITNTRDKEYGETLDTLAHLVNVSSDELKELNQNLEQRVEDKVKELQKTTQFFQNIFETSKEGIWVLDMDQDTLMSNKAISDILGYTEDELLGQSIFSYMDKEGEKSFKEACPFANKNKPKQYEIELIHKDKSRRHCLFTSGILSDEEGEDIGSFVMISDITKRKHAEEELVSFNCLLEERIAEEVLKNHSKDELMTKQMRLAQMGEMISMIAHQWRQPLSTISAIIAATQLDLTLKNEANTPLYTDMEKVTNHIQFLSDTIDDFRHFFNPKKSKDNAKLADLLNNSINIIKQSLIQKNIDLICDFDELQKPIRVYASELVQVFLNLLKNSMDALIENKRESAYILIRGSEYEGKSVLIFEDNGGGVGTTIMDKIFEPYFTTKDERNGTGLGLYMSKMIIEEHCNGQIIVENTQVGARFTIVLNDIIT